MIWLFLELYTYLLTIKMMGSIHLKKINAIIVNIFLLSVIGITFFNQLMFLLWLKLSYS